MSLFVLRTAMLSIGLSPFCEVGACPHSLRVGAGRGSGAADAGAAANDDSTDECGKSAAMRPQKAGCISVMPRYDYYTVLKSGMQGQNVYFYVKKAGQRSDCGRRIAWRGVAVKFSLFFDFSVFSLHRRTMRSIIEL